MHGEWPIVGRRAEISFLQEELSSGRGVVLAGATGVGKTRLARETATWFSGQAGWSVEVIAATRAAASIPLGALAHLDDGRASEFLTPIGAVRQALVERAAERRLLLVVDDAHALDLASAAMIHQLAVAGDATVLATARSGGPTPDAVVALWKDGLCERLDLHPLSDRETGVLLEQVLDGRIDPRTRFEFWEVTRGNNFFLRELVSEGLASGALAERDGRWCWSGAWRAPRRVSELVATQMEVLPPGQRTALELVALGEPFEWELLVRIAPSVETAVAEGLVTVERSGRRLIARLSHPFTGDVVRTSSQAHELRRRLRVLAAAVQDQGLRRRHDPLRVVGWLEGAGDRAGPDALTEAARCCIAVDPAQAERLSLAAIEAGAGLPAVIVLAQQLMFSRRAGEAAELLDRPPVAVRSDDERVALAVMRANNLTFGLGRGQDAALLLDEIRRCIDRRELRAQLLSQTIPMLLFAGQVDRCSTRIAEVLGDDSIDPVDRLRARITNVAALAVTARPVSAQDEAAAAFAEMAAAGHGLPLAGGQIAAGLILARQWIGDLDGADELAQLIYDDGLRRRSDLLRGVSALYLGVGLLWRGRVRSAIARLREAVDGLGENDVGLLGWAIDNLRAAAALSEADERDVAEPPCRHRLYETERLRLSATIAAAANDRSRAARLATEAAAVARGMGLSTQVAFALYDCARYGVGRAGVTELDAIASTAEGDLLAILPVAARALGEGDGPGLDEASARFEKLGFVLYAAETARAASCAHVRAGLPSRAAASERCAFRLSERCEGASTPLLNDVADVNIYHLTSRERDVAALAAAGLHNAEIADNLGVSTRTVETHLQRVYNKLGVHRRSDLDTNAIR